jgi:hypothetical protein
MSYDESTKNGDFVPNDNNYDYVQTTSSPKDTMMHNIRGSMPMANTDYEPLTFAHKSKLVKNPVPFSRTEEEESAARNHSERYDESRNNDTHADGADDNNYNDHKSEHYDNATTATQSQTANKHQSSKYETKFNTVNGSAEDNKNKFKQQLGGKVFTSAEEELLAKYDIMRELGEMAHYQGVKLSQNYTLKSNYEDMLRERNLHKYIKDKHEGTKWLSDAFLHGVKGMEWLNQRFDPFGFNLEGWSDHVKGNINDQYGTFSELYEKYVGQGVVIPPELKLVFALCSSAVQYHGYNSALQLLPNLGDDENKDLIKKLREEAQVRDKGMKQFVDEKHEQANEQLQRLTFIKQKEREQNEYNRNRGLYEIDNMTNKSVKSKEIQSEKERLQNVLKDLDALEEKLKEMKSTAGSIQSKKPSIVSVKQYPIQSTQIMNEERETEQTRKPPVKSANTLNKYVKPKVNKPASQTIATTINPDPISPPQPNKINTRTAPRAATMQNVIPGARITAPVMTQIPTSTPISTPTPIPTATPTIIYQQIPLSQAAPYLPPSPQPTTASPILMNEIVRNTRQTQTGTQPQPVYNPNLSDNKSRSSRSNQSNNKSIESMPSSGSWVSRESLITSEASKGSRSSIASKSSNISSVPSMSMASLGSGVESLISSQSNRSSRSSVSSQHITPINQILRMSDKSSNRISESSSIKSVHSQSETKIEKPQLQNRIPNFEGEGRSNSGSASASSGKYTQYSGGSVSIIKGRNGKTKKVISIVTKPLVSK